MFKLYTLMVMHTNSFYTWNLMFKFDIPHNHRQSFISVDIMRWFRNGLFNNYYDSLAHRINLYQNDSRFKLTAHWWFFYFLNATKWTVNMFYLIQNMRTIIRFRTLENKLSTECCHTRKIKIPFIRNKWDQGMYSFSKLQTILT